MRDAHTTKDGHQAALDLGETTTKVTVTAEDGNSTRTYTVVVTRDPDPVSNTGQSKDASRLVGVDSDMRTLSYAQRFTTGDSLSGYDLEGVDVSLADVGTAAIPKVSVYTDSSGEPGTSLYVLTNPSTLESSAVNTFFTPGGATLDAETQYWVVFENDNRSTSSADHYYISGPDSDAEDTGAASGWSISNLRSHRVEVDGPWNRHNVALCIAIQGSAKPDTALSLTLYVQAA